MSFIESIKDVFGKRRLIMSLAAADFRKRFVGSYFGVAWMFVQPIVTIVIYFLVFQVAFRGNPPIDVPYIIWFIPGIIPWFFFSEALNHATNCLFEYSYLVKKVVFKVSILPLVKIVSCIFVHGIFLLIMMAVFFLYGKTPSIYWLQVFYYAFCMVILLIGLSFITASITVLFRDMAQIVNIGLQLAMWATPIMWHPQMEQFKGKLDPYLWVFKINPMYYVVEGYRASLISHVGFWELPGDTLYFWCFTLVTFVLGLTLFKKLKPHFADVL
ncbi:ABC transporter permease [Konateibacter massiliensis]|uniref:ABC transporter permease n=1 Tax=Konateibacter massiliensis TaxID=2002841 RepID=UPI000C15689F|nr:ABC transporter permease [Konateibacter massiliensis]